jgi:hypothetical protein
MAVWMFAIGALVLGACRDAKPALEGRETATKSSPAPSTPATASSSAVLADAGPGPEFYAVDSREKAEGLCRTGTLQRVLLLPKSFGGQDIAQNVVFVPTWLASVKSDIDERVIAPLVAEGKVTHYQATPEYQGRSFVPIAIHITASDPGEFSNTIKVWGSALSRGATP